MADTRQVVSWALERKCAFRSGDQWFLPARTCAQLADLRTVAAAEGAGRIVNDICVTGWTTERDNSGMVHEIPCSGFRIEERLGPVGGLAAALETCRGCEANAKTELDIDVAGCFGHLDVWPDSEEFDRQLGTGPHGFRHSVLRFSFRHGVSTPCQQSPSHASSIFRSGSGSARR
jgi:hypothetical protein